MKRQNINYLHLPEEEKWNAPMILLAIEGTNEEASGQGQPGRGAAAAEREGAGELSGEGPSAAGAAGLVDDGNQEGHGAGGGDRETEGQPQEPVPEGMGDNEAESAPVPAPRRKRSRFTRWQLQKLETVFQYTHYIKGKARRQLATSMGVSEAKVQNWFNKKRAQYRKYHYLSKDLYPKTQACSSC